MKRFLGFVKKEWFHIFRDQRTLLILFGMPLAQILLFGYAVTNEIREANIALVTPHHDEATLRIREKLLASGYFHLARELEDVREIEDAFKAGEIKLAIAFTPDFDQNLQREGTAGVQVVTDATDPNIGNTLLNYASGIILDYQQERMQEAGGEAPPMTISVEPRMRYNPELKGVFLFVPGLITIILMLVSAMMTSISITREKEMGTMEVLLASPMKPIQVILAKVSPYIFLSMLNATLILFLGYFVFGVPIKGSILLLAFESALFIIAALSLGILISTATDSQQVALMISLMALMLPTILLSGFMFPIENMPLPLQYISNIIPAKWFIIIVKDVMLKGSGLGSLWMETLILIGFTLFFMLVSMRKFKIRLE
ncbi:MAG: ABC transporter permease [Bacteroidota bacterium]